MNVAQNTRGDQNKSNSFFKGPQGCFRLPSHQELASSLFLQEWEHGARWCTAQNVEQSEAQHRMNCDPGPGFTEDPGGTWREAGEALGGRVLASPQCSYQFSYL